MTNDEAPASMPAEQVRGKPVPVDQRERIRQLVDTKGLYRTAQLLGCSKDTVTKTLAGLGVMAGTRALIAAAIDERDRAGKRP